MLAGCIRFAPPKTLPVSGSTSLVDVTGDGKADVLVDNGTSLARLEYCGTGCLQAKQGVLGPAPATDRRLQRRRRLGRAHVRRRTATPLPTYRVLFGGPNGLGNAVTVPSVQETRGCGRSVTSTAMASPTSCGPAPSSPASALRRVPGQRCRRLHGVDTQCPVSRGRNRTRPAAGGRRGRKRPRRSRRRGSRPDQRHTVRRRKLRIRHLHVHFRVHRVRPARDRRHRRRRAGRPRAVPVRRPGIGGLRPIDRHGFTPFPAYQTISVPATRTQIRMGLRDVDHDGKVDFQLDDHVNPRTWWSGTDDGGFPYKA